MDIQGNQFNTNSNVSFGLKVKSIESFRRDSNRMIKLLDSENSSCCRFERLSNKLLDLIFDATKLDKNTISNGDKIKHEKLKSLYEKWQDNVDYMDGCGFGGTYQDNKLDIFL